MTTNNVVIRGLPSNIVELAQEAATARSLRTLPAINTPSYRFEKAARDLMDAFQLGEVDDMQDLTNLQNQLAQAQNQGRALQEQLAEAEQERDEHCRRVALGEQTIAFLHKAMAAGNAGERQELEGMSHNMAWGEKFDGNPKDLRGFILKLRLRAATLPSLQEKLRVAVGALEGRAMNQLAPYVTGETVALASLEELIGVLELAFGDPDKAGTA